MKSDLNSTDPEDYGKGKRFKKRLVRMECTSSTESEDLCAKVQLTPTFVKKERTTVLVPFKKVSSSKGFIYIYYKFVPTCKRLRVYQFFCYGLTSYIYLFLL